MNVKILKYWATNYALSVPNNIGPIIVIIIIDKEKSRPQDTVQAFDSRLI